MVALQSSSHSRPTVYFWYTAPGRLLSIRLLSSGPSASLYHSTAFLHMMLKCVDPTGHSKCQLRVTSYRGDDGWCHSWSPSIEHIAMCVCIVLTHHCNSDNTWRWVVMMWLSDICLAVIDLVNVRAYNWWTLIIRHMTTTSSDWSWRRNYDQSQSCNTTSLLY